MLPLFLLSGACVYGQSAKPAAKPPDNDADVVEYISGVWARLTRSMSDCKSLVDPKVTEAPVLYLPANVSEPPALRALGSNCKVDIERLHAAIHHLGDLDTTKLRPGLLYLPNPYVVPGGMFNEMYGWDSYFIIRGLIEDGKLAMARNIVENFLFEVEYYGGILNSNRTYHLTRSQPPFLTAMVRAVYEAEFARGKKDVEWLARAYPDVVSDYRLWVNAPHLAGDTGLSRYYDFGEGPVPELDGDEESYYRAVAVYFLLHPAQANDDLVRTETSAQTAGSVGPVFSVFVCKDRSPAPGDGLRPSAGCDRRERLSLSRDFYKGDRSMRESGYDVSFRFGPFGANTHHSVSVDLNSLLYKTETDLAWMNRELGHAKEADEWDTKARLRRARMDQYLWNATRGLYFDYDFEKAEQSSYQYATTFFPLWVGAASPSQAQAVERNFATFDRPGGIDTSPYTTGAQWDNPYGWAPLQLVVCEGLRHYGDAADARLATQQFMSMVAENFRRDGTIREKYNVVTRSSETQVRVGYSQNQVGFGWTNGVYLVLRHEEGDGR